MVTREKIGRMKGVPRPQKTSDKDGPNYFRRTLETAFPIKDRGSGGHDDRGSGAHDPQDSDARGTGA